MLHRLDKAARQDSWQDDGRNYNWTGYSLQVALPVPDSFPDRLGLRALQHPKMENDDVNYARPLRIV